METKIQEKLNAFNQNVKELVKPREIEEIYGSNALLEHQCEEYCRRHDNCRRDKSEEQFDALIF
jgi:hypothetical protein